MTNQNYVDYMKARWESPNPHTLEHRVGIRQFDPEIVDRYHQMIFDGQRPRGPINILEYGCGVGRLVIPFSRKWEDCTFVGIDISDSMIDEATRRAADDKNCTFITVPGDGTIVQTVDKRFHHIYSTITLQHICSGLVHRSIFRNMVAAAASRCRFAIQVKKWRQGLRTFDYEVPESGEPENLENLPELPEYFHGEEGNAYTQAEFEYTLNNCGLTPTEVRTTAAIDDHGEWLWAYGTIRN